MQCQSVAVIVCCGSALWHQNICLLQARFTIIIFNWTTPLQSPLSSPCRHVWFGSRNCSHFLVASSSSHLTVWNLLSSAGTCEWQPYVYLHYIVLGIYIILYIYIYILGRCLLHRGGEPEQAKGADGMQLFALDCIAHIVDAETDRVFACRNDM